MLLQDRPLGLHHALMKYILILLLMPLCTRAADLYQIHTLSESDIQQTYIRMLHDACFYSDRDWKSLPSDPREGYWGDGVSAGNQGIRTVASLMLACATLLKYDDALSVDERRQLMDKVNASIRYITETHITGPQKCTDGKHWGATEKFGAESWQSGMWTGTFAFGAWLAWDKLDPSLQKDIQRVIGWEDDILSKRPPPNNLWLDTKAEENGWEVPCLVLGELMFPSDPRAASWREGATRYMLNTLCTAADTNDTNVVDGRPVNEWVHGANLQPDFTLENHNFFHPSYVACSSYFMTEVSMYYTYARLPIPQAATHHVMDIWHMFQTIILPWGENACPQGMDWELHGLPPLNLYATLATHNQDPFAARMEQTILQYMHAWQEMDHGSLTIPGSKLGITRHAINAEQIAYGFLAHKIFGPAGHPLSERAAAAQEDGVWEYPYVDFIEQRTGDKFVSFSWKNKVMGLLMPIGTGHEGEPFFTVPIPNGFAGSFELSSRTNAKPTVVEHSWSRMAGGFETTGTLLLNGGRLKQTLTMISVGDQTVVYEDHVVAVSNVTVQAELGVPMGIENDEVSGGYRVVTDEKGQTNFDWKNPRQPVALAGSWANVDGRLGVVSVLGSGITYAQAHRYSPGISVYADVLYGSYSEHARTFNAGDEVARRVVVFYTGVGPEETASLARSCKIGDKSGKQSLHLKQPGGKDVELPLN
jgi:hypothetical protein